MTDREAEIYKIIRDNPMISQNEIAQRLGITRSAVSVYLNNMTKKGILRGRGYLLNDAIYPVIIGPGHIDILSHCEEGQNTAGTGGTGFYCRSATVAYGGAVKNVASYLARLECHPRAIFSVGADFFGSHFLRDCRENGINVDGSLMVPDGVTPIYNEISTASGRIASAYMKDNLADRLSASFLYTKQRLLKGANEIVFHDSLSYSAGEYITSACADAYTIFFSVMYPDTIKFMDILARFKLVILPLDILFQIALPEAVVTVDTYSVSDLKKAFSQMREMGVTNLIVSCTPSQICYMQKDTFFLHNSVTPPAFRKKEVRTHRDAFVAGIVYCHENDAPVDKMLDFLAASKLVAMGSDNFFETHYCLSLVEEKAKELNSELKLFRY